jgi:hypothetical protein
MMKKKNATRIRVKICHTIFYGKDLFSQVHSDLLFCNMIENE